MPKQAIPDSEKLVIEKMYNKDFLTMVEIAKKLSISTDAVLFFMRKHKIERRSLSEAQRVSFEKSVPSFTKKKLDSTTSKELAVIGAMLYWGEGYKGTKELPAKGVDFANSDPKMVQLFLKFMRSTYLLDETKFRILLYCYSDQNKESLISFWSGLTAIPKSQFSKPYVRTDFRKNGRKMMYGLIHVRYSDKKLLLDIKNLIDYYVQRHAPIV